LKVAQLAAAATATDFGTVRAELLLAGVTLTPPLGAEPESVTVQVAEDFGPKLVGVHTSEDNTTEATRLTFAVAELLL
jgi:hypothetical protein